MFQSRPHHSFCPSKGKLLIIRNHRSILRACPSINIRVLEIVRFGNIKDATLVGKIILVAKIDRIHDLPRAFHEIPSHQHEVLGLDPEAIPGLDFGREEAVIRELEARVLAHVLLQQDGTGAGAVHICDGDDVLFHEKVLVLVVEQPLLAFLLRGADEFAREGLVFLELGLECVIAVWTGPRLDEIELFGLFRGMQHLLNQLRLFFLALTRSPIR